MKKVLLIAFLALSSLALSQSSTKTLSNIRVGTVHATHNNSTTHNNPNGLEYVYLGFQNEKYKSITDIHSIMLSKQEDLEKFTSDLEDAISKVKLKESIYYRHPEYRIVLYDFTQTVYLYDTEKPDGYCQLSAKQARKLLDWLKTVKLSK